MDVHTVYNLVQMYVETQSNDLDLRRKLDIQPQKLSLSSQFVSELNILVQSQWEAYYSMITFRANQDRYPETWSA